jgi:hypothetical protein
VAEDLPLRPIMLKAVLTWRGAAIGCLWLVLGLFGITIVGVAAGVGVPVLASSPALAYLLVGVGSFVIGALVFIASRRRVVMAAAAALAIAAAVSNLWGFTTSSAEFRSELLVGMAMSMVLAVASIWAALERGESMPRGSSH